MSEEISANGIVLPDGGTLNIYISNDTYEPYPDFDFIPTQISHEVPLSMLEMSRGFNDYDYALVHLFKDHPQYYEFYKKSVEMGRKVILDNSLYELGEAFDMREYAEWIEKLQPTYYIIPDTFWSSQATIDQAMEWMINYGRYINPSIKKIGVAQGATYNDIKRSYQFMDSIGCDCIAFTFKFSPDMLTDQELKLDDFLDDLSIRLPWRIYSDSDLFPEDKQAACRYLILKKLDEDGVINHNKEHHLLGLQNTTLLFESCRFPWVTSIDTSNPVINGFVYNKYVFINSIIYDERYAFIGNSGAPKPEKQLKDYFYDTPSNEILNYIMHNIRAFREIVNPLTLSTVYLMK